MAQLAWKFFLNIVSTKIKLAFVGQLEEEFGDVSGRGDSVEALCTHRLVSLVDKGHCRVQDVHQAVVKVRREPIQSEPAKNVWLKTLISKDPKSVHFKYSSCRLDRLLFS